MSQVNIPPISPLVLKNYELNRLAVFFVVLVFLAMLINGGFLLYVLKLHKQTLIEQQKRQDSLQITYGIEQETAALSRMVRAYTTSTDTRFLKYYYDIIDIRKGTKAPPENYGHNYWAEVIAGKRTHVMPKDTPGQSLLQRMKAYGFANEEFLALDKIIQSSQDLYDQDQIAFAATQGLYDPVLKEFVNESVPQPQFANHFVYSEHYLELENDLFQAVESFANLTDQRTKTAVHQVSAQLNRSIYAAIIMLAITVCIVIAATGVIRKMVLAPMRALTQNALSFGAGDYTIRADVSQGVLELQALGQTFNSMAKNIEGDIFHREKIQQALEIATVRAEDSTRAKSLFLANMSHEIRTPMNAIVGMTYLIQNSGLDGRQQDYATKIEQAARSLLRIINDILDFSKIEAGKLELENISFRLEDIVKNVQNLLGLRAEEKNLQLLLDFKQSSLIGDQGTFLGDPVRLEQIITNLLSNAVKFTEKGFVKLTIEETARSEVASDLLFHIEDTGIGMTKDQVSRLFQEFSQADGSTTRKHGGTGLGLSISKRLLTLMEGHISVSSTVNTGTEFVFSITLPHGKKIVQLESVQGAQSIGEENIQQENMVPSLPGMKVLLVEDNVVNQQIALEMLGAYGVDIDIAGNGQEALDMLDSKTGGFYHAVLMDIQMPVMDGYEATRIIRNQTRYDLLPIIAMTAHAMEDEKRRCERAGMNNHIAKPFDIAVLLRTLATYFTATPSPIPPVSSCSGQDVLTAIGVGCLPENIPGLDLTAGLSLCQGKVQLYQNVLQNYMEYYGKSKRTLSVLFENNQWDELSAVIHTLKGLSGTIGAVDMQALCVLIEQIDTADKEKLRPLLIELDEKRTAMLSALTDYFAQLKQPVVDASPPIEQQEKEILVQLRYLLSEADGTTLDFWADHLVTLRKLLPSSAEKDFIGDSTVPVRPSSVHAQLFCKGKIMVMLNQKEATILCVDDTPNNLFLLVELLKEKYRVKTATSGEQAIQLVAASRPDLILLDIMMPDVDGLEICRRLKASGISHDIPVLFLTAKTQVEDEAKGLSLGAADYIHKPISPPILLARIHHHLEIKKYHDLLQGRNHYLEEEVIRRINQLNRMQEAAIHVMTALAEFRDEETGNHIRRTQEYMRLLVDHISQLPEHSEYLTVERMEQIVNSAPLHDVGKIAIPDTILLKPGKLTYEEFEIMKLHTVRGHDILAQAKKNLGEIGGFLDIAQQISQSHHEKWDGSGYPHGLAGSEIPLAARMMAVADVYDAIRSARPYKKALSHEDAITILKDSRGSHLDSKIVDVFLSFDMEVQDIRNTWDDQHC